MYSVVVFSDDWGRHPSSCQHLFRRLLDRTDVTWVNTVGLRTPRLSVYDIKRAWQVLGGWFSPCGAQNEFEIPSKTEYVPHILAPTMLPTFRYRIAAHINQKLLLRALQKALASKTNQRNILVSTLPIIPYLFSADIFDRTIYYCVDDFTTWPGVDGRVMRLLEDVTLQNCDILIATSEKLLQSRGAQCQTAHLLSHGVDCEHFAHGSELSPMPQIATLPKPVIGFFGIFDDRSDGDIITRLAREFTSGSVVIVGPVDRDLHPFASLSNLYFFGSVSYQELPAWAAGFDVCILPYKVDESTLSINPLKLREYLATNKPVVATPIPEALRLSQYLRIAAPDEFPIVVRQAIETPITINEKLNVFLYNESWDKKAEEFWRIITDGL
jgi:glycosyltransferase involved in cell wall biosynthesis